MQKYKLQISTLLLLLLLLPSTSSPFFQQCGGESNKVVVVGIFCPFNVKPRLSGHKKFTDSLLLGSYVGLVSRWVVVFCQASIKIFANLCFLQMLPHSRSSGSHFLHCHLDFLMNPKSQWKEILDQ